MSSIHISYAVRLCSIGKDSHEAGFEIEPYINMSLILEREEIQNVLGLIGRIYV